MVEILLVLALMALGGAVLLPAMGSIFRQSRYGNPEDVVAEVLQQVRREAVLTGREVALRFEPETQRFTWEGAAGPALAPEGARMKVEFLRPRTNSSVLIGGQLVETAVVPVLRFFPDGTCDAVRVQLRTAAGAGRILAIDPWTCAPGLEVKP